MKKGTLVLFLLILSINFIFAGPPVPQGFNGNIIITDGLNPDGELLVGYVNGIATGQAVIEDGKFDIVVTGNKGEPVIFKIGTEKAKETFTFKTFDITVTNLTFRTITDTNNPCGDGICAVEECSFCAIDCPVSKCNHNSICETAIGEDCITAPSDCGTCLYCGDSICNNGETCSSCPADCGACPSSGGGGGGGGSSSSSSSSSNTATQTSAGNGEDSGGSGLSNLSIEKLNENNEKSGFGLGITGAVTGFAKSGVGIGAMAFILILIAGTVIMFSVRKKKPGK